MNLTNLMPVLLVKDAKKSCEFYAGVLGLTVISDFGGLNYGFKEGLAIWQLMDDNIIPQKLGLDNILDTNATSRFEMCFETTDLDNVYETLKKYGVKFLHEINTEVWGQRSIRFYDPDGHLIEVGEAMHIFVARIFEEEGKNVEAAAKRMFMQPEALEYFLNQKPE